MADDRLQSQDRVMANEGGSAPHLGGEVSDFEIVEVSDFEIVKDQQWEPSLRRTDDLGAKKVTVAEGGATRSSYFKNRDYPR